MSEHLVISTKLALLSAKLADCRALNAELSKALEPFASLGIGSGPNEQQDAYNIEFGAIRKARAALAKVRP